MREEKKKQKDVVHEDYNSEYESTEFEIDEEYLESTDYLPSEEAEDFDEDAPDIVEYAGGCGKFGYALCLRGRK